MSGIRTHAAATMLGVSPNTLRSWERRYGFPRPERSAGGHRQYALREIESLRQTLAETHDVSSAVSLARERGPGLPSAERLVAAFCAFDEREADRLLEESLAVRSLERTLEEVLLGAAAVLAGGEESGPGPEYEFAWRHGTAWMAAMKRLSPPTARGEGVLMLDGSRIGELDGLYAQALELMLRRAGVPTLTLSPSTELSKLGRAVRALAPRAMVLTGRGTELDSVGRLVYSVRRTAGEVRLFDYRNTLPDTGASTVARLDPAPVAARDELLEWLAAARLPAPMRTPA